MKHLCFYLTFLLTLIIGAKTAGIAAEISVTEFLSTATTDYILDYQNKKIAFLKGSSSNTPFFNEIELKTQIDKLEKDKQSYSLRLSPNGWGEARDGKKVYTTTLRYNEAQHDLLLNQVLRERYNTVIDFLFYKKMIELNKKLMILFDDRVRVLKRSVNHLDFNANDLIDAEDNIIRLQIDLIDLENKIINIEDAIRINLSSVGVIELNTTHMAGIAHMQKIIKDIGPKADVNNVHLVDSKLSAELAAARYQLERSENRKYLSFIEASYDLDDRDDFEKAFSVEFGISIPIVNPNRLDINRRKLNSIRETSRYENKKREMVEEITILSRDLKRLIRQYGVLIKKKKSSKAESSLKTYQQVEGSNPLILLKLRESTLKTEMTMQKIKHQIYEKYIKFLDLSGKLFEKPFLNYISKEMELLIQ